MTHTTTQRFIVKKSALELITDQQTLDSDSTIVILASDVLAIRQKLHFLETIANEHISALASRRYSDNDEGDMHFKRDQATIREIKNKLAM